MPLAAGLYFYSILILFSPCWSLFRIVYHLLGMLQYWHFVRASRCSVEYVANYTKVDTFSVVGYIFNKTEQQTQAHCAMGPLSTVSFSTFYGRHLLFPVRGQFPQAIAME